MAQSQTQPDLENIGTALLLEGPFLSRRLFDHKLIEELFTHPCTQDTIRVKMYVDFLISIRKF